jgi:hypothetical protein
MGDIAKIAYLAMYDFCPKKQKPSGASTQEGNLKPGGHCIEVTTFKRRWIVIVPIDLGDYVITIEIPLRP